MNDWSIEAIALMAVTAIGTIGLIAITTTNVVIAVTALAFVVVTAIIGIAAIHAIAGHQRIAHDQRDDEHRRVEGPNLTGTHSVIGTDPSDDKRAREKPRFSGGAPLTPRVKRSFLFTAFFPHDHELTFPVTPRSHSPVGVLGVRSGTPTMRARRVSDSDAENSPASLQDIASES